MPKEQDLCELPPKENDAAGLIPTAHLSERNQPRSGETPKDVNTPAPEELLDVPKETVPPMYDCAAA